MGIYDRVRCLYPLPWPAEELRKFSWRSKGTPAKSLEQYEIRADGTLWHEAYTPRWEGDSESPMGVRFAADKLHWEQVFWEGELEIHDCSVTELEHTWYSVRFWFREGVVRDLIPRKTIHPRS